MTPKRTEQPSADTGGSHNDQFRMEDFVSYYLVRISKVIGNDFARKSRQLGLTVAALQALSMLAEHADMTVGELSDAALIEQPTLTKILNRLESDKLIRRKVSRRDKRIVHVHITRAGREIIPKMAVIIESIESRLLDGLSATEIETASKLLSRMSENVNLRRRF